MDGLATHTVSHSGLKAALALDSPSHKIENTHPLLHPPRSHIESYVVYLGVSPSNPTVPLDGTYFTTGTITFLPTSRGTVTLSGKSAEDDPVLDPNYVSTEADRFVFRSALRKVLEMLGTKSGREFVEREVPPDGVKALGLGEDLTDEELDARVRIGAE
jgi:choline dehydrogenase-like flavoprotein